MLVRKKDGSLRLSVDYRQLNGKTRKDAFPLPRIDESLDALTGARWFSTMDLASGYNLVPVADLDWPKTAFCTPFRLFEWNRMPFGLSNAPSTFQRLMQRIFGDQQCQSLLLYLDDIVFFSSTIEQHLERLEVVLGRFQHEGLKVVVQVCLLSSGGALFRACDLRRGCVHRPKLGSSSSQLAPPQNHFRSVVIPWLCQLLLSFCGGFCQNGCSSA